ncbi:MAG TPA: bifunctional UDP-sugar hydrolase/5'-nucleotidase [Thermotogota bacterium]|nr:bifunctional UDP-sugar hydrolase/5'-nucleotidase [Thermotogota bacterium]HPJ89709.1 bifunctional UDP-sugar hydrolase/5'-nucleotidase [Thermotogota bacterium]HPR96932.1 bifunctional UDP-sugar hydrolase/5'-nucleotidase [Thermotogota bacterium]
MKKLLILILVLLLGVMTFGATVNLTIMHTSDLHGNVFPIDYASNKPANVGLAKVSTILKTLRAENDNVLAIDSGDFIQGTPLEYYHAKIDNEPVDPMILAMNAMDFDCTVIGNHEFNYGLGLLDKAESEAEFPFLSANVVRRFTSSPYYKPYAIYDVEGVKVAVLGLTTDYIPNWEDTKNIAAVDFGDPVEAAKYYVKLLREEEGADVVIVAYHGGLERDPKTGEPTEDLTGENQGYQLLEEVEGIDVLLTGHQHRSIAAFVLGVPVTMPSNWGKAVGKIDITLDNGSGDWLITAKSVELISTSGVEADEEIINLVQSYEDKVQAWLDTPVGTAKGEFYVEDPLVVRLGDDPLIEYINKVQMEYSGADISSSALFSNDIKGWKDGPVTLRDINGVYIYANTLKVIEVSGQDIKDALELTATYFTLDEDGEIDVSKKWVEPKPRHYNYDMWEGIDYVIDVSKPEGERITKLDYHGEPLDMDGTYQIVLNNYRAGGGGGYFMFQGKPVVKDIMMEVSELMGDYLLENKVIDATIDENWEVVK